MLCVCISIVSFVILTERDDGATGFALVMQNSGKLALPMHGRDPFEYKISL